MDPQSRPDRTTEFRLLLASTRWAVHTFFWSLRKRGVPGLVVEPLATAAADLDPDAVQHATAVAVDLDGRPAAAIAVCRAIRKADADVPILALLCCPQTVNPWNLHEVLGVGASILDLQATPEEAARALANVARGESVFHLKLGAGQQALLRDVLSGRAATNITRVRLLELLTLGLRDHEIAKHVNLSPHTVKHHIEALRDELRVRNRTELAAWAGRHGFYAPDGATRPFRARA